MNVRASLPLSKQLAYACGMMGWSMMINLISVILVYLYAPTKESGLPVLITQAPIFVIFNAIALITAGGRMIDAFYDPFIAQVSDSSKNPKGRRIPMMKRAILPSMVFCLLVFIPLFRVESNWNVAWLAFALIGFYLASTTYAIPYNALLPELAPTSEEKVRLATWQSVGFVFGIGFASNAFNVSEFFADRLDLDPLTALQWTVGAFIAVAGGCMLITVLAIDEKQLQRPAPNPVPMKKALRQTLTNRNFLLFIVADFSFYIATTIITTGLIYFVTILLRLDKSIGNKLIITMVLVSFLFYPVVVYLARRIGKKIIVLVSLAMLSLIFLGVYSLGRWDFDPQAQIYLLIVLAAIPLASLGILPNAIMADIIERDTRETGENKEAIYFAVRYFFVKIAQTIGIALFAMFLLYGQEVGNDFGIRLNGLLGFGLCLLAALIFTRFREKTK